MQQHLHVMCTLCAGAWLPFPPPARRYFRFSYSFDVALDPHKHCE